MTAYIIRHADKETGDFYNPDLRHNDPPLSRAGRDCAERLAAHFAGHPISAIYVSAYRRATETTAPLARQHRLTPVVDPRLNEIDNGAFDPLTDVEVRQIYPQEWQAFIERKADFRFPGGETGEEARQRIASFLQKCLTPGNAGDIIAVTHEGLIRLLMCHLMRLPVYDRWNFEVDPCGVMEISYQADYDAWKLIRFNQVYE